MTAIWFSRHPPTSAQVAEIQGMGYTLDDQDPRWAALAARNLTSEEDVRSVVGALEGFASGARWQPGTTTMYPVSDRAIFGVFAAPVQEACNKASSPDMPETFTPCYSAWNITRSVEGGKPSFAHLRFCRTGQI